MMIQFDFSEDSLDDDNLLAGASPSKEDSDKQDTEAAPRRQPQRPLQAEGFNPTFRGVGYGHAYGRQTRLRGRFQKSRSAYTSPLLPHPQGSSSERYVKKTRIQSSEKASPSKEDRDKDDTEAAPRRQPRRPMQAEGFNPTFRGAGMKQTREPFKKTPLLSTPEGPSHERYWAQDVKRASTSEKYIPLADPRPLRSGQKEKSYKHQKVGGAPNQQLVPDTRHRITRYESLASSHTHTEYQSDTRKPKSLLTSSEVKHVSKPRSLLEVQDQSREHRQKQRTNFPEKDKSWIVKKFSFDDLRHLIAFPSKRMPELFSNIKRLTRTLEQEISPKEFDMILQILFSVAQSIGGPAGDKATQIVAEAFSPRCARFQLQLKLYTVSNFSRPCNCSRKRYGTIHNSTDCRILALCTFFQKILDSMPSMGGKVLPVPEFAQSVTSKQLSVDPELLEAISVLQESFKSAFMLLNKPIEKIKISQESRWDNSEFRTLSMFPAVEELRALERPSKLRPSVIEGRYSDWMHYFDVQYRLLREDFTAPLRRGISGYIEGSRWRDLKDVRVYCDTRLMKPVTTSEGAHYQLNFSNCKLRCNWEHSKRLLHGSLVCLSADHFKTIYFATVTDRKESNLKNGLVSVDFQECSELLPHCRKQTSFVMIESSAYFEASRHIMTSLQTAEVETMPFTQYLIANNCSMVNPPHYLQNKDSVVYKFCLGNDNNKKSPLDPPKVSGLINYHRVHSSDEEESSSTSEIDEETDDISIDILDEDSWSQLKDAQLDSSQLKALKMALTQEISVIQGPPGTGKTYIGIQIVRTLLANKHYWRETGKSPILVMCYTNHALDQFLEGILKSLNYNLKKVIRVGGRCKSEILQECSIANRRNDVYVPSKISFNKRNSESQFFDFKKSLENELCYFNLLSTNFLDYLSIEAEIHPEHRYQLLDNCETTDEQNKALEIWLGLWEKYQTMEQIVPVPQTKSARNIAYQKVSHEQKDLDLDEELSDEDTSMPAVAPLSQEKIYSEEPVKLKPVHSVTTTTNIAPMSPALNEATPVHPEMVTESIEHFEEESESVLTELIDVQGEGTMANNERLLEDYYAEEQKYCNSPKVSNASEATPEVDYDEETNPNLKASGYDPYVDQAKFILQPSQYYEQILMAGLGKGKVSTDEDVQDINELDMESRWKLYNYWRHKHIKAKEAECAEHMAILNELGVTMREARKEADRFVLETADIIGMTTSGVAKYQHILHMVKPRIVIVEEAAEVLESHIVSALNAGTQHLILIGDHKQLKPKPNEYYLAKKCNMDVSLFERLVRSGLPLSTLNIQHRMRPIIADLVRPAIYNELYDHESVLEYSHIKGVQKNLYFIQHEHNEQHDEYLLSYSSEYEASFIVELCHYLLKQGYKSQQITILVTYTGQFLRIRALMPKNIFDGVIIRTVDNYQGEENDIVLLSLVRSNESGDVGFLRENNRVCVSISRAKMGFYCIGNFQKLAKASRLWETLQTDLTKKGYMGNQLSLFCNSHPQTIFSATSPEDIKLYAPDGGCQLKCEFRLDCGHVCTRSCHHYDLDHKMFQCKKSCPKKCPNNHSCPKRCFMDCGNCITRVVRELPQCGHMKEMFCYRDPPQEECLLPCEKKCPNGHNCPLLCHQPCVQCKLKVAKEIPTCHHIQMVPCYQDPEKFPCEENCTRKCEEGHPCLKKCSQKCGDCKEPVVKVIKECGHKVTLPCSSPPTRYDCKEKCNKKLACGHLCRSMCQSYHICSTRLCEVPVTKKVSCGHSIEVSCHDACSSTFESFYLCKRPCTKLLACNHPCKKLCHQSCTNECMYTVHKVWPCGHKLRRKCYQTTNPENYPCKSKCKTVFSCGHLCTLTCGEPCSECKVLVKKTLPCGHSKNVPCHKNVQDVYCDSICKQELACGHRCDGKCKDCTKTRIHQPCKFGFKLKRFCGHSMSVECTNMSDEAHDRQQNKCLVHCIHSKCTHPCSSLCPPCDHPCPWTCPHHTCDKLCHEMCERPKCDQRCTNPLKCGHQCFGVCGEPCLDICPECKRRDFNKWLINEGHKEQNIYIQLKCKHIFTVHNLDRNIEEQASDSVISPLCCPVKKCSQSLIANYRYGNLCKSYRQQQAEIQENIDRLSRKHVNKEKTQELHSRLLRVLIDSEIRSSWNVPLWQISIRKARMLTEPSNSGSITMQENFLCHILAYINEMLKSGFKSVDQEMSVFLKVVVSLLKKSKLSAQIIQDIRSELFRLNLLYQVTDLSDISKELEGADEGPHWAECEKKLKQVKGYLDQVEKDTSLRLNVCDYTKYSILIREAYSELGTNEKSCFDSETLVTDIAESTPPLLKGVWRKCKEEHFYCTPLRRGDQQLAALCPECVKPAVPLNDLTLTAAKCTV